MAERDCFVDVADDDQLNCGYFNQLYYQFKSGDESIAENAMQIVVLSYDASLSDIERDYMVVDMFSDSTGYSDTICTADTTSDYSSGDCWYCTDSCAVTQRNTMYQYCCVDTCSCKNAGDTFSTVICVTDEAHCVCLCTYRAGPSGAVYSCATSNICGCACLWDLTALSELDLRICTSNLIYACNCSTSACLTNVLCLTNSFSQTISGLASCSASGGVCTINCCQYICINVCNVDGTCWDVYCDGTCVCNTTCSCLCYINNVDMCGNGNVSSSCSCVVSLNYVCVANVVTLSNSVIATNAYDFGENISSVYLSYDGDVGTNANIAIDVFKTSDDSVLLCNCPAGERHTLCEANQCVYFHVKQNIDCQASANSCLCNYAILVSK